MTPEQTHILVEEIWLNAGVAMHEYVSMLHLLADDETRQHRAVWIRTQAFLTHAAMTSKFLFPIGRAKHRLERAERLRRHLGVTDESPLGDRSARDNVEHFDERLDSWISHESAKLLEVVLQSRSDLDYLGESWFVRRVILLDEMVLITPDRSGTGRHELSLRPLAEALDDLVSQCEKRFETDDPFHYLGPVRGSAR